jgi:hypothetical protein
MQSLLTHAAWCAWAVPGGAAGQRLVRLLRLLSGPGVTQHVFPPVASFTRPPHVHLIPGWSEVTTSAATEQSLAAVAASTHGPAHAEIPGFDEQAKEEEGKGEIDGEGSGGELSEEEGSGVEGEGDEQEEGEVRVKLEEPSTTQQQQQQQQQKQLAKSRKGGGGGSGVLSGVDQGGAAALLTAAAPLQPAWLAGSLLPALLRLACDKDGSGGSGGNWTQWSAGQGHASIAAGAARLLAALMQQADALLLPASAAASGQLNMACKALVGWAGSCPRVQLQMLMNTWCSSGLGLAPDAWSAMPQCTTREVS